MNRQRTRSSAFLKATASPCTAFLLAAIWLVFAVELSTHALESQDMLLRLGALPVNSIQHKEYWRLLTYALLHSGWWHIALNTFLLLVTGPIVERKAGAWFTLSVSILGAVGGGAAILLVHHGQRSSIEVGASGAFFALLGAALVMAWEPQPAIPSQIYRRLRTVLLVGLAISFVPRISMAAHLAGLAVGCVLAVSMRRWGKTGFRDTEAETLTASQPQI